MSSEAEHIGIAPVDVPAGGSAPLPRLIRRLAALGARPEDTEEERLRKGTLILASSLITVLSVTWVATYLAVGRPASAAIPFAYQVATVAWLCWFVRTKRFAGFRLSQLLMMLMLPCLLQVTLGGFVPSSGVVLWAAFAPIGALMLLGVRESLPWFATYGVLLVVLGLVDQQIPAGEPPIPVSVVVTFFVMNLAGVSLTIYAIVSYFVRERDEMHAALELEQERSERLLLNVLPRAIAERLKDAPDTIAEHHDEVTVLFADLVGFTAHTERTDPHRLVAFLDELFTTFDQLADEQGLEKIKTIGDAYMVAGGLPEPRPDHAVAVAEMALAMREHLSGVPAPWGGSESLALRIGIDSGPVVAGVIGRRKFIYDLWGDTVNTASRMESHGVPDAIQVTSRTQALLLDRYAFRPRGRIDIKGKGEMEAYLLLGRLEGPEGAGRDQGGAPQPRSAPRASS
jgi:guanylate cyclase